MTRIIVLSLMILLITSGCEYLPDNLSTDPPSENTKAFINTITPAEAEVGKTVSFSGYGEDSDGTVVAYRWYSDLDGELSVKPEFITDTLSPGNHIITFRVQDNNGNWSQDTSQPLIITAPIVPVPIIELYTASPLSITAGQSSELHWQVKNADAITIEPSIGVVAANAAASVSPDTTTIYTLTAANSYGTVNTQVTITVTGTSSQNGTNEIVLYSLADEDGTLVKYSSSYEKQTIPCAGDNEINLACRAFLSFDISSIPSNALIQEAVLDLSNCTVNGNPTYAKGQHGNMGALEVYHYQYGTYENLERTAYLKAAQLTEGGSFQNYPLNPWKWDINKSSGGDQIIQKLVGSGASRCQLRIQFFTSTNWDGVADMICFEHAVLTIRYTLP